MVPDRIPQAPTKTAVRTPRPRSKQHLGCKVLEALGPPYLSPMGSINVISVAIIFYYRELALYYFSITVN